MKVIEYKDIELTISEEINVAEDQTLVLNQCKLIFASGVGITSLGAIIATDCAFEPMDKKVGWKGIADIGKRRSSFHRCTFIGGRGRPLKELKDHYISRYFGEIDDLEIIEGWSGYEAEDVTKAYQGRDGGALITLNSSVKESVFEGCRVDHDGGAMIATFNVDIDLCRFQHCRAGVDGGALVMKSHGSLSNSLFLSCRAGDEGGGVLCDDTVTIKQCHFKKCVARSGGGIATHAKAQIYDCAFLACIATNSGGGLDGKITGNHLVFRHCHSGMGGGADLENGSFLTDSMFYRCHAKKDGGGVSSFVHEVSVIERCVFNQCSARGTGGGASVRATLMRDCLWKNNTAIPSKPDNASANHLYASGGSIIQSSHFEGHRNGENGVLPFVLFESTML
jgi:hypothetical protein